jgi:deoxyribonuclease (pyrimidine dimer)
MTRINCIPVTELMDQHLMAEYREITRISKLARPLNNYGKYCMGTGHVKFFYNKGGFLSERTEQLYQELKLRGFNITYKQYQLHATALNQTWQPTIEDEMINANRLNNKIDSKPNFYTYNKRKQYA